MGFKLAFKGLKSNMLMLLGDSIILLFYIYIVYMYIYIYKIIHSTLFSDHLLLGS